MNGLRISWRRRNTVSFNLIDSQIIDNFVYSVPAEKSERVRPRADKGHVAGLNRDHSFFDFFASFDSRYLRATTANYFVAKNGR